MREEEEVNIILKKKRRMKISGYSREARMNKNGRGWRRETGVRRKRGGKKRRREGWWMDEKNK